MPDRPERERLLPNSESFHGEASALPARAESIPPGDRPSPRLQQLCANVRAADEILKAACDRVKLEGVSTHSFRRTALTRMSNAGVPLRHIQEISGHKDLATLQKYLEVSPEHRKSAIAALNF